MYEIYRSLLQQSKKAFKNRARREQAASTDPKRPHELKMMRLIANKRFLFRGETNRQVSTGIGFQNNEHYFYNH